ncbi:hypothetical protein CGCSCA5_v013207 [Colletotrichum siamense]|nr:hypothetical protein CGCSCA5_v013207 [Colletotrichum siamense]
MARPCCHRCRPCRLQCHPWLSLSFSSTWTSRPILSPGTFHILGLPHIGPRSTRFKWSSARFARRLSPPDRLPSQP